MRILLLCSLLAFAGCSSPVVHPLTEKGSYSIPVTPASVEASVEDLGTSGFEAVKDKSSLPDVIITVPPSTKATVVEVKKAKRSVVERVMTNKPAYEVKSDNPGTVAEQPKNTVWWKWILLFFAALGISAGVWFIVVQKIANFSPWGFILGLFKRK